MWHLKNFTDRQLIDIVKNYEIYKYDIAVKYEALEILKSRGISEDDLELVGNPVGDKIAKREALFKEFTTRSNIAFILYLSHIGVQFLVDSYFTLALFLALFIAYLVFIILSFISQKEFYKAIGQPEKQSHALVFVFIGMPLYPFYYWYLLRDMKECMKS